MSHGFGARARKRNTPTLIGLAGFRTSFDWDGRAHSLSDQLTGVFATDGDMGIDIGEAVRRVARDTSYVGAFAAHGWQPNADALIDALVVFQESLIDGPSRFDRFYLQSDSTALTKSERRGWELFSSARTACAGCHVPVPEPVRSQYVLFTDNRFHNLGIGYDSGLTADPGRFNVTGLRESWGRFRIPTLRNIALTSPYMHDGSLVTLEDVVRFYERGGLKNPNLDVTIKPFELTSRERADLVAFLRALTVEWLSDSTAVANRFMRIPLRHRLDVSAGGNPPQ